MGRNINETLPIVDIINRFFDSSESGIAIVPRDFYTGRNWSLQKKQAFIDSLIKGYPLGTIVLYKQSIAENTRFILVDGIQRISVIKEFLDYPAEFCPEAQISLGSCSDILAGVGCTDPSLIQKVRKVITRFIATRKYGGDIQFSDLAHLIISIADVRGECSDIDSIVQSITSRLNDIFSEFLEQYSNVLKSSIPVVVYSGDEKDIPYIYARLNTDADEMKEVFNPEGVLMEPPAVISFLNGLKNEQYKLLKDFAYYSQKSNSCLSVRMSKTYQKKSAYYYWCSFRYSDFDLFPEDTDGYQVIAGKFTTGIAKIPVSVLLENKDRLNYSKNKRQWHIKVDWFPDKHAELELTGGNIDISDYIISPYY